MQGTTVGRRILITNGDGKVILHASPNWNPLVDHSVVAGDDKYKVNNRIFFREVEDEMLRYSCNLKFILGVKTYVHNDTTFELNRKCSVCTIGDDKVFIDNDQYYTTLEPDNESMKNFLIAIMLLRENRYSVPVYSTIAIGRGFLKSFYNSLIIQCIFIGVLYAAVFYIANFTSEPEEASDAIARVILFLLVFFDIIAYMYSWRESHELYSRGTGLWVTNICFVFALIAFIASCVSWSIRCEEKNQTCKIEDNETDPVAYLNIACLIVIVVVSWPYDIYIFLFR